LGLLFLWSSTYAAQLFIDPQFSDPRFEPSDKLHAWCIHTADVNIKTSSKENISSFRFVVSYEPQNIEILDIKANEAYKSILDSKIEYDKIIVSVLNKPIPQWELTKLFTISFKSSEFAKESIVAIRKPSYVVDQNNKEILVFVEQNLNFENVPECEPDIVPPTISLIKPQNTTQPLGLDSYFVFWLKDQGKWIDKNSVVIDFDWITYTWWDSSLVREKDQLTFYPRKWLPIWKNIELDFSISDKQTYWWANTSKKIFSFVTQNGIVFENSLTPAMYRNITEKAKAIYANSEECAAISFLANNATSIQFPFEPVESLSKKINCKFDKKEILQSIQKNKTAAKSTIFISVFSVLWWVLFGITFILKLHYMMSYNKHRKISKSLKSSGSMQ